MGNVFYLVSSIVPLGFILTALAISAPNDITATLASSAENYRTGDAALLTVEYEVGKGVGGLEWHLPLPESFELVEGTNVVLVAKRLGRRARGTIELVVRPIKRGPTRLGPLSAEAVHALGVRGPRRVVCVPPEDIDVRPASEPVRRVRGLPGIAKQLFPENDDAVTGIATNEFAELREYIAGDVVKSINWRATARQPGFHAGHDAPLVNEYEKEGKKSVWLYFDAAPYMMVGTTLDNSFEAAIKAATGLASFYADRGYRIGGYVYNSDGNDLLYPDIGRRQILRWQRMATHIVPGEEAEEGLLQAVERTKRYLLEEKPLVIIVTRASHADDNFFQALRKLRGLTGRRRRTIPVLVVSPVVEAHIPNSSEYAHDLVNLTRMIDRPVVSRIRRMGARVIEWDATRGRLEAALMRATGGRGR